MAIIKSYFEDRDKWDLFTYPSDPPPTDIDLPAGQRSKIYPTGFNPNHYLSPTNPLNQTEKLPEWRYVNIPFRRLNNKALASFDVYGFRFVEPHINTINTWNQGFSRAVAISDRCMWLCAHMTHNGDDWFGSFNKYRFLNVNNQVVEVEFDIPSAPFISFNDNIVVKLSDNTPGFEELGVPILTQVASLYSLPTDSLYPLYKLDPQGRLIDSLWFNTGSNGFPLIDRDGDSINYVHDNTTNFSSSQMPHSMGQYVQYFEGDSGSPCFIRLLDGSFMFAGSMFGGDWNNESGQLDWMNERSSDLGSPASLVSVDVSGADPSVPKASDEIILNESSGTYQSNLNDVASRIRTEVLVENQNPVFSECSEILEQNFIDSWNPFTEVTIMDANGDTLVPDANQELLTPQRISLSYKHTKTLTPENAETPPLYYIETDFLADNQPIPDIGFEPIKKKSIKSYSVVTQEVTTLWRDSLESFLQSSAVTDFLDGKLLTLRLTTKHLNKIQVESFDLGIFKSIFPSQLTWSYDPEELVPGNTITLTLVGEFGEPPTVIDTNTPILVIFTNPSGGFVGSSIGVASQTTITFSIPQDVPEGSTILISYGWDSPFWNPREDGSSTRSDDYSVPVRPFTEIVRGVPCVCDTPSGILTITYCRTTQNNAGDCLYEDTLMKIFLENLQPTSPPDCVPEVIIWDDPLNDFGKPIRIRPVAGGNPGFVDFEEEFSLDPGDYFAEVVIENCNGPVTLQQPISITDSSFGCLGGGGGGVGTEDCSVFTNGGGGGGNGGGGGGSRSGTWGFYDVTVGFSRNFGLPDPTFAPLLPGGNNDLISVCGISLLLFDPRGNPFFGILPNLELQMNDTDFSELQSFSLIINGVSVPVNLSDFRRGPNGWVNENATLVSTIDSLIPPAPDPFSAPPNIIVGGTYTVTL